MKWTATVLVINYLLQYINCPDINHLSWFSVHMYLNILHCLYISLIQLRTLISQCIPCHFILYYLQHVSAHTEQSQGAKFKGDKYKYINTLDSLSIWNKAESNMYSFCSTLISVYLFILLLITTTLQYRYTKINTKQKWYLTPQHLVCMFSTLQFVVHLHISYFVFLMIPWPKPHVGDDITQKQIQVSAIE